MKTPPPLADRRLYNPGDIIVREGEVGYAFFLIEKGQVEVFKETAQGEVILGHIGADGIFGEMALVDDSKRMASVRATELTTCKVFPREYFYYRMGRSDKLIRAILKIFTQHIRSLTKLQAELGTSGGEHRPTANLSKDILPES